MIRKLWPVRDIRVISREENGFLTENNMLRKTLVVPK
jgi:hypothetical protein